MGAFLFYFALVLVLGMKQGFFHPLQSRACEMSLGESGQGAPAEGSVELGGVCSSQTVATCLLPVGTYALELQ